MDDTKRSIHESGAREFVGGDGEFWDRIGALQYQFLVDKGLFPSDTLIDVGCGSLRGGVKFIQYLEPGHYLGLDKHIELIIYGVANELGIDEYKQKQPQFAVSDNFEFNKFTDKPTFAIAQSLFSHINSRDIESCLFKLYNIAAPKCRFFATFKEVATPVANPEHPANQHVYSYTRAEMESFGVRNHWKPRYIGAWGHPRNENMMEYIKD
jgi:hypothetical protein